MARLGLFGTTPVAADPVFSQGQLARAAELGIGVGPSELIDLVTDDRADDALLTRLQPVLGQT